MYGTREFKAWELHNANSNVLGLIPMIRTQVKRRKLPQAFPARLFGWKVFKSPGLLAFFGKSFPFTR